MAGDRADAGLKQKRETQRERIRKAIAAAYVGCAGGPWSDAVADAAIAAYPDPYVKKERGRPKLPTDDCVLCATRAEFVALVEFIEGRPDGKFSDGTISAVRALARALREQGVV